MRLYTCFTESHRSLLYDYFLPSLIPNEYQLTVQQLAQHAETGDIREQKGFIATMRERGQLWVDAIVTAQNEGEEFFLFTDCDIQFFGPTKEILCKAMEGRDLVAQDTGRNHRRKKVRTSLCGGFFVCRANERMLRIFTRIRDQTTVKANDQVLLNRKRGQFKCRVLDKRFWANRRPWVPGLPLKIPHVILMHHANWTFGVQNKARMLSKVRDIVWERKGNQMQHYYSPEADNE